MMNIVCVCRYNPYLYSLYNYRASYFMHTYMIGVAVSDSIAKIYTVTVPTSTEVSYVLLENIIYL